MRRALGAKRPHTGRREGWGLRGALEPQGPYRCGKNRTGWTLAGRRGCEGEKAEQLDLPEAAGLQGL